MQRRPIGAGQILAGDAGYEGTKAGTRMALAQP